ncbi:MAG: thioredoxin family protein [Spirochaetota bacterium]
MKKFEILGTGCPKCNMLQQLTEQAAKELGVQYEITKVTDIKQIMNYGVMITPALVVDGKVKVAGKIPSLDEIKKLIQ